MTRQERKALAIANRNASRKTAVIETTRVIVEAGASGSTRPKTVAVACRNLAGNPLPATRLRCKQTVSGQFKK